MPSRPPNRVRIVGGRWKRTVVPVADLPGLRPTPDRVRETLFNWLGQALDGVDVLDLFAGSGALGLEAASRGARTVVIVDCRPVLTQAIRSVLARLDSAGIEVLTADAKEVLARLHASRRRFGLVFLDPPFHEDWIRRMMPAVVDILAPGAKVYVESESPVAPEQAVAWGFTLLRMGRAGQVHYHLLEYSQAT